MASAACCTIPPVEHDYVEKGKYDQEIGKLKAYTVGNEDSEKVIIFFYDIFGYYKGTMQGVDGLASLGYKVIVPDFLKGKPFPLEKFLSGKEEDKQELGVFFNTLADPTARMADLKAIVEELKAKNPKISSIGLVGLCWGAKVCTMYGGSEDLDASVKAIAAIHPAMVNPNDAKNLKIPYAFFPSKDEPTKEVEETKGILEKKDIKFVYKLYDNMHHGWAGARAKLKDDLEGGKENIEAFKDVYERVGNFFKETL